MKTWRALREPGILLTILVVMSSAACQENSRDLLGGYRLVRMYDTACAVVYRTEETVVPANVVGFAVVGELIVGHSSTDGIPAAGRELTRPGFFIIDTKGEPGATTSLDREAWLQELRRLGVQEPPRLERPQFRSGWM